ARHGQVEREQIRLVLAHFPDQGRNVCGFGDDPELARLPFQDGAYAVADDRVIVGDDHLDRSGHPWHAGLHGRHGSRWRGPTTRSEEDDTIGTLRLHTPGCRAPMMSPCAEESQSAPARDGPGPGPGRDPGRPYPVAASR